MASSPGDPFAYPKASGDMPPNYQSLSFNQPTNPPHQEQPRTHPGSDFKGMAPIPPVPPGMELLVQMNQILIQQKYFTTQRGKTYEILNTMGQRIFLGMQDFRCCFPKLDMKIMDNSNKEIMHLLQPCKCTCTYEAEVHAPLGTIIGYVTQNWNAYVTSLSISNASKETVLLIVGPSFRTNIFGDVNFEVKSTDEMHTVGKISRDNERFVVQFPLDLDVNIKAVLIGSAIILDYMVESARSAVLSRANN